MKWKFSLSSNQELKFKILAKNVGVSQEPRDVRPLTLDQTSNNEYIEANNVGVSQDPENLQM